MTSQFLSTFLFAVAFVGLFTSCVFSDLEESQRPAQRRPRFKDDFISSKKKIKREAQQQLQVQTQLHSELQKQQQQQQEQKKLVGLDDAQEDPVMQSPPTKDLFLNEKDCERRCVDLYPSCREECEICTKALNFLRYIKGARFVFDEEQEKLRRGPNNNNNNLAIGASDSPEQQLLPQQQPQQQQKRTNLLDVVCDNADTGRVARMRQQELGENNYQIALEQLPEQFHRDEVRSLSETNPSSSSSSSSLTTPKPHDGRWGPLQTLYQQNEYERMIQKGAEVQQSEIKRVLEKFHRLESPRQLFRQLSREEVALFLATDGFLFAAFLFLSYTIFFYLLPYVYWQSFSASSHWPAFLPWLFEGFSKSSPVTSRLKPLLLPLSIASLTIFLIFAQVEFYFSSLNKDLTTGESKAEVERRTEKLEQDRKTMEFNLIAKFETILSEDDEENEKDVKPATDTDPKHDASAFIVKASPRFVNDLEAEEKQVTVTNERKEEQQQKMRSSSSAFSILGSNLNNAKIVQSAASYYFWFLCSVVYEALSIQSIKSVVMMFFFVCYFSFALYYHVLYKPLIACEQDDRDCRAAECLDDVLSEQEIKELVAESCL